MKRKAQEAGRRRRITFFLAFVTLVFLVAVFGDKGLVDVYRLKKERDRIISYNRSLEEENSDLDFKIRLLKEDKRYMEYVAREELGMIGRNEVLYKIGD